MNLKDRYLEQKVFTASKEELLLMLIDGAVKFAEQGRASMEKNETVDAGEKLIRAQKIVGELICAVDPGKLPEQLYKNISGLYYFCYFRLIRGNVTHDIKLVDEAIKILKQLQDMWHGAVRKMKEEAAAGVEGIRK